MLKLTAEEIITSIENYQYQHEKRFTEVFSYEELKKMRLAAVMIPMFEQDGKWHLLLTKRAESLVKHGGQVAFPGGAHEEQDAGLRSTALREMHEEIGVAPKDVNVFGQFG